MRYLVVMLALVLLAVACGDDDSDLQPTVIQVTPVGSGVDVTALSVTACPAPEACTDTPIGASFRVTEKTTSVTHVFDTDALGRLHLILRPGTYEIEPVQFGGQPAQGPVQPQTVIVNPGHFVPVTLKFDSGAR